MLEHLRAQMIEAASPDVVVGRQAIYDTAGAVAGYELLFRSGPEAVAANRSGAAATSQVIVSAFTAFDFDELTGGLPGFVNLTDDFLRGDLPVPLVPGRVVLEVLETVNVDDRVVEGVAALAAAGYAIALDDFVPGSEHERLLAVSSYVKIDFLGLDAGGRAIIMSLRERYPHLRFVAERLETPQDIAEARELGYELFQGYALDRPVVASTRTLSASRMRCIQLLGEFMATESDVSAIVAHVSADPALSYRLLRAANCAWNGSARRVATVHGAVMLLGIAQVRDWVMLMLVGDLTLAGDERMADALIQAQLCRLVAERSGLPGDEAFVVGMLSSVAEMIGQPVKVLSEQLPLSDATREALVDGAGPLGAPFCAVTAYLHGVPPAADAGDLVTPYLQAVRWATETVRRIGD
ncbi:HDOD domain-containing protein [Dactylosporangium vinaceum]|uniref:EAL and HDOD domain-containing protein n=1 Tax=Dactylosporangium vinaceum TaxID=53362 RepID=A0ABV5MRR3_9ACTN|nr:HDOD domain-containing protein [Dactylosporangium vinaceum]UAC00365.1 HDOD domain-containing protein [Dactylosporangium vinaceum]